jgi:hypothetical protein
MAGRQWEDIARILQGVAAVASAGARDRWVAVRKPQSMRTAAAAGAVSLWSAACGRAPAPLPATLASGNNRGASHSPAVLQCPAEEAGEWRPAEKCRPAASCCQGARWGSWELLWWLPPCSTGLCCHPRNNQVSYAPRACIAVQLLMSHMQRSSMLLCQQQQRQQLCSPRWRQRRQTCTQQSRPQASAARMQRRRQQLWSRHLPAQWQEPGLQGATGSQRCTAFKVSP